ncbi:hypothetical protein [Aeromicrobium sp. CTD01-1L150]|uniref:hypothetical protein n=1 Tax=Aeromicrobium sp. CTD01-1L150 TaxID=3341830 RepID=UPI0035C15054
MRETLGTEPAVAFASLIGVSEPDLDEGLPLLWHWLYMTAWPDQADLGPDGHPVRGGIPTPPGPGRRRMWAGGEVRSLRPLMPGREAVKRSRVLSSQDKDGRSGRLTFARIQHTVEQAGELCVDEVQLIVYRDAATGPEQHHRRPDSPESPRGDAEWDVPIDPTVLFRFSALTKNAHRIHYDADYARDVEGYSGLVVHGPLQAMVQAEAARGAGARGPVGIEYRLVTPLHGHEGLCAVVTSSGERSWETSIRSASGRVTSTGTVRGLQR